MSTQRLMLGLIKPRIVPKRSLQRFFSYTGIYNNESVILLKVVLTLYDTAIQRERTVSYPRFAINPEKHGRWINAKDLQHYQHLDKGKKAEEELVTLTGRIVSKRESSAKLVFYDIVQNGETMQVVASRGRYNGTADEFTEKNHELVRGDIACKIKVAFFVVLTYFVITTTFSFHRYTR